MGRRTLPSSYNVSLIFLLHVCNFITSHCLPQSNVLRLAPNPDALGNGKTPPERWLGFFHKVKIIHTTRGPKKEGKKEEITYFYGETATLSWDPDRWRWVDGYHYLNYTT